MIYKEYSVRVRKVLITLRLSEKYSYEGKSVVEQSMDFIEINEMLHEPLDF